MRKDKYTCGTSQNIIFSSFGAEKMLSLGWHRPDMQLVRNESEFWKMSKKSEKCQKHEKCQKSEKYI